MKKLFITFINWHIIWWLAGFAICILAEYIFKIQAPLLYLSVTGAALVLFAAWGELLDSIPEHLPHNQRKKSAAKALINRPNSVPAAKVITVWGCFLLYCVALFTFLHTSAAPSASHTSFLQIKSRTLNQDIGTAPAWLAAIGTISAVIVALWQIRGQRQDSASRLYFDKAETALRTAVEDFLGKTTPEGRPLNDRRHWLNFARGIGTAQELANKIKSLHLKDIWRRTEQYWRARTYDALDPVGDSFPAEYYGYTAENQLGKNIAQEPGERAPLSEASLAEVYTWIRWPEGYPDSLDREKAFSDAEIENMKLFGPRGLAEYINILQAIVKHHAHPNNEGQTP